MVNGGSRYNLWFVTYLTNVLQPFVRRLPDAEPLWGLLSRGKASSRETYRKELQATVEALRCHPCIGCWVPFNEGWGQFDAAGAVQAHPHAGPIPALWTRPAAGTIRAGEMWIPCTTISTRSGSGPGAGAVALSEYGGIAWPMPGHEPPRRRTATARQRAGPS